MFRLVRFCVSQSGGVCIRRFSNLVEQKINIDNLDINYVKIGSGNHVLFCLPGVLGDIRSHFGPQICGLDKSKFTIICWDAPGFGKSRPPERDFSRGYIERDADIAFKLLQKLNISRCSLLGWSDGGKTAIVMSGKYPQLVDKMIMWGTKSYICDDDVKYYTELKERKEKPSPITDYMMQLYGREQFINLFHHWIDCLIETANVNGGNICKDYLPMINSRTLIIHGTKDKLTQKFHVDFLRQNIRNSKFLLMENDGHFLHISNPQKFNETVQSFLLEE